MRREGFVKRIFVHCLILLVLLVLVLVLVKIKNLSLCKITIHFNKSKKKIRSSSIIFPFICSFAENNFHDSTF